MKKCLLTFLVSILTYFTCLGQTADDFVKSGKLKANAQNFDEALRDFNKAIILDSTLAEAYFRRGQIRLNDNMRREAKKISAKLFIITLPIQMPFLIVDWLITTFLTMKKLSLILANF